MTSLVVQRLIPFAIAAAFIAVVMYAIGRPEVPSEGCKYFWQMREKIRYLHPNNIAEIQQRQAIMSRAETCDRHPETLWF